MGFEKAGVPWNFARPPATYNIAPLAILWGDKGGKKKY